MSAKLYERQVLWREYVHRRVSRMQGVSICSVLFGCYEDLCLPAAVETGQGPALGVRGGTSALLAEREREKDTASLAAAGEFHDEDGD